MSLLQLLLLRRSKTSLPSPLRFFSSTSQKPTSPSLADLINGPSLADLIKRDRRRSRDFPLIRRLRLSFLTERLRAGCFNTTSTVTCVTRADCFTLLPCVITCLLKGVDRKNAFDSLVARLSNTHPDHALHVLDIMLERGIGANAVTFYPLLSHFSRDKRMDRVADLLDLMGTVAIPPDTTCYNYVLSALCHLGDLRAAAATLNSMLEEGLVANSLTFDTLVLGACRAGKFDGAVALVRRMEEGGVYGMYSTYAHIIRSLLHVDGYRDAMEFVRGVGGTDGRLDGKNYGVLGKGLLMRGRWKR